MNVWDNIFKEEDEQGNAEEEEREVRAEARLLISPALLRTSPTIKIA